MKKELYTQIFRRKSFHTFKERSGETINIEEINDIYNAFKHFDCLNENIVDIKIERNNENIRNAEYLIKIYSTKNDGYLQNVGYIGEQLDLYLVLRNIGSLWYGIYKSNEVYKDLDYVILIAISKVNSFRDDMYKAKRKQIKEIWLGEEIDIANIVRFAPSACNSQPWLVENKDNKLFVYRKSSSGRVGIMPKGKSLYYNQIDIGIFMCFLELCLLNENIDFEREIIKDSQEYDVPQLNAIYSIKN